MTTSRGATTARAVLVVAAVGALLLILLPDLATTARSAVTAVAAALRGVGHGTLAVGDGFLLAMCVTAATIPLPVLLAVASRASRPWQVRTHAVVAALLVLVLAALVATGAGDPWARFRGVALAGLVGVALGVLVEAAWQARHRAAHASGRTRRVAWTLAAAYALVVVLVATAGSPVDGGIHPWLVRAIALGHRLGVPQWLDYGAVEFTANVCFFVPFGFFVLLLFGARAWWAGMLGGCLVSCAIETVQGTFLPARFASVDDVLSNTAGAVLGVLVGIVVLGRARAGAARGQSHDVV